MIHTRFKIVHAILFIILVTFSICFFRFAFSLDNIPNSRSSLDDLPGAVELNSGWQYHWGDSPLDSNGNFAWLDKKIINNEWASFQFPGRPNNKNRLNSIWIRTILPKSEWKRATLRFRAPQQALELYLDKKLIYNYGDIESDSKVRTPGSIWHMVELPPDFDGKALTFRLHSPFTSYTGYLIETEIGNRSSLLANILKENAISVIFGCLFILLGIGMILFQIASTRDWWPIIFLGLSFIFFGGWYLSESKILQLFINAPVSMTYAANFFIFLMPVWLLIYADRTFISNCRYKHIAMSIMCHLHLLLAVTAFTLDMAGIVSSLNFEIVLHVFLAITAVLIIFAITSSSKGGIRGAKLFISGIIVLGITGMTDTFMMFYNGVQNLKTIRVSYLGMLYFLTTLLLNLGKNLKNLYEDMKANSLENETNYKSLFTNMSDGFTYNRVETDSEGIISSCIILKTNDSFAKNAGMKNDDLTGMDIYTLFPEIRSLNINLNEAYMESAAILDPCMEKAPIKLGSKWFRLSSFSPKKGYLGIIFSDITFMKNAEETIRHQAYTDSMTGFYNRTFFEEIMAKLHESINDLKPLSIIAIDIDGLKITNDTFGHNAGDELLKQAARIISSVFDKGDIIARVGGDEFCVILKNTDYATVQDKAEKIVKGAEASNIINPTIPISMSVGVATSCESSDENVYEIYRRADDRMYSYKISQTSSEKSKVIDMLLSALSEKDYVSQGHVERLVKLSILMSDALGLHDIQKRNLILLSKVHDLGKIGIPDEILNKPGKLTPEQYEKMKQHVKIGYNIASRSKELVTIAPLILHHHEHWDGNGYPDSLKGEDIPLECRILGIIDAYDAMTNDRPYHNGIPGQDALIELSKFTGKQFDPDLVPQFIKIISNQL